jgi:hypothetical protein
MVLQPSVAWQSDAVAILQPGASKTFAAVVVNLLHRPPNAVKTFDVVRLYGLCASVHYPWKMNQTRSLAEDS